jgi:hypothetical protein
MIPFSAVLEALRKRNSSLCTLTLFTEEVESFDEGLLLPGELVTVTHWKWGASSFRSSIFREEVPSLKVEGERGESSSPLVGLGFAVLHDPASRTPLRAFRYDSKIKRWGASAPGASQEAFGALALTKAPTPKRAKSRKLSRIERLEKENRRLRARLAELEGELQENDSIAQSMLDWGIRD